LRLLLDQDVYYSTEAFLRSLGHGVVTAAQRGYSTSSDLELLNLASTEQCLLVTRDRHFGALVFVQALGAGVLYLRMRPTDVAAVHSELETVLSSYSQDELSKTFVVIESGRHRLRHL
jgi:predicted nuclease of predicted toxin-antitoxin system